MIQGRKGHSFNAVGKEFLIATGGRDKFGKYLNGCELYEIAKDEWTALPPLQVARTQHTGCVVGNRSFYVFCGRKETFMGEYATNEIEFLESKNSSAW